MWSPTHVQVAVQRAVLLIFKGKNSVNDCFVTIALGKVKYQTSVKEKAEENVEWHEECELPIPEQGNTAELVLTVLHRNFLGDEFLGRVAIPLSDLDPYERPKNRWYSLLSKPGKESTKERGKLEVKVAFTVKSGSLTDLSKKEKHKSSLSHIVGGSLLSIGSVEKRKGIKKFAKSIGSKIHLKGKKKKSGDGDDADGSIGSVGSLKRRSFVQESTQKFGDADPGVISEDDDDFTFDELSHKSSGSSLNHTSITEPVLDGVETRIKPSPPTKPPRAEMITKHDEWEQKLYGGKLSKSGLFSPLSSSESRRSRESTKLSSQPEEDESLVENTNASNNENFISIIKDKIDNSPALPKKDVKEKEGMLQKLKHFRKDKSENIETKVQVTDIPKSVIPERIIIGGENNLKLKSSPRMNQRITNEILEKYDGYSREDLILLVMDLKKKLEDYADYVDDILLRVMETTPRILQNPYIGCKPSEAKLSG